jgi:hypothetical protein
MCGRRRARTALGLHAGIATAAGPPPQAWGRLDQALRGTRHEIDLSDPNLTVPEKLKTVVPHPNGWASVVAVHMRHNRQPIRTERWLVLWLPWIGARNSGSRPGLGTAQTVKLRSSAISP